MTTTEFMPESMLSTLTAFRLGFPRAMALLVVFPLMPGNSMFLRTGMALTLVLFCFPILAPAVINAPDDGLAWAVFTFKEIVLGSVLGWSYAVIIWAMEYAGTLLDSQTGTANASIFDPLSNQETALISLFFKQFSLFIFITAGGVTAMLESYAVSLVAWPVTLSLPFDAAALAKFFTAGGANIQSMAMSLGLPILSLLFFIDITLGLMNRSIPQLNAFTLASPVKFAASLVALSMMATMYAGTLHALLEKIPMLPNLAAHSKANR